MTIEKFVLRFAGTVVLVSLALAHYHHHNWIYLTAFVGVNLIQASFTGFCPLASVLRKLGFKGGDTF